LRRDLSAAGKLRLCATSLTAISLTAMSLAAITAARAQSAEPFYAGKTINLIVGAGAGGSYDIYARTLANHLTAHIPGKPTIVVKLAGGVGGGVGTSIQVEHTVPKDGTTIGMTQQTNVTSQLVEPSVAGKYDISKWRWIGNMAPLRNFVGVWHTAPAQSLEEATRTEVILGATGRNSPTFTVPQALNEILGTKFKFVLGYNGAADLNLAMERGEIQGRGASWISVVTQAPQYIAEKKLKPLAVDGLTRDPLLPDVPTLLELARTPEQKAALLMICGSSEFARAFFLPPGVPQDRVETLRKAFDETMKDPAFLAEADKAQIPIEARDGASLDEVAARIVATPAPAVALAKKLLGGD
jgi:tripartite-type tricarboxylate transporter receptor subunit TctC